MSQPAKVLRMRISRARLKVRIMSDPDYDVEAGIGPLHKPLSVRACYIAITLIGWGFAWLLGWGAHGWFR